MSLYFVARRTADGKYNRESIISSKYRYHLLKILPIQSALRFLDNIISTFEEQTPQLILLSTITQFACIADLSIFYVHLAELTQFREDGNLRKFTHENGRLIAQKKGYYHIYAQVFFETYPEADTLHNRVALSINGHAVSLMQSGLGEGRADYGSVSTGVVNYLKEGDYISLKTEYPSKIWMSHAHTFFGAYRVRRRA